MKVSQDDLIKELEAVNKQKAEHQAMLHRLDGAEQVIRHLLGKTVPVNVAVELPDGRTEVIEAALNGENCPAE